jgi:N utilization substance protein B
MPPAGRRSARRQAVFILYQQDLLQLEPAAAIARENRGEVDVYTRSLVLGVGQHREEIDRRLVPHLANWSLERLGALERSILRLATFELLWEDDVPAAVAVDEAVTLARRFCSDEAGALVNGVLGALVAEAA